MSDAPTLIRLARVDSTQTVALALAAEGAPDRTAVVADEQRAGRGRRGRAWVAAPGTSLLLSVLLRPGLPPARQPLYSFAAAVAVSEAVTTLTAVASTVKWPNDVLIHGRKVAGILLEAREAPAPAVVVGIGVNVNQRVFPPDLEDRATSLALVTGAPLDREAVLAVILQSFDHWRARLEREGFEPVRVRWCARAATLGRWVRADGAEGTAIDLDPHGALVLAADGRYSRVTAGEVHAARPVERAANPDAARR